MTTTKTADVDGTLSQVYALRGAGADIVRITCNDAEAAQGLAEIVPRSPVPIIADIHFQYRLALGRPRGRGSRAAPQSGQHPQSGPDQGGGPAEAKDRGVPIRVGVNAGSLDKDILEQVRGAGSPGAGRVGPQGDPLSRRGRLHRHQDLGEAQQRAVDGRVLPSAVPDGRPSAPPRGDRGRPAPGRADEVGGRHRHPARSRASATPSGSP